MGQKSGANPWQQDPFAAYDDPIAPVPEKDAASQAGKAEAMPAAPTVKPDYSAWRRPAAENANPPRQAGETPVRRDAAAQPSPYAPRPTQSPARPDFTAKPAGFPPARPQPAPRNTAAPQGAGLGIVSADPSAPAQRGEDRRADFAGYGAQGAPAAMPPADKSFAALGADAPTRIARPGMQMVNKHTTVDRGTANPFERSMTPQEAAAPAMPSANTPLAAPGAFRQPAFQAPAAEEAPVRRRRAGRISRYEETPEGGRPTQTPDASEGAPGIAATRGATPPRMDFDPFQAGDSEVDKDIQPEDGQARPARRPAVPGERYTGARTALPQKNMPPQRDPLNELPLDEDAQFGAQARAMGNRRNNASVADRRPQRPQSDAWAMEQDEMTPQAGQRAPMGPDENGRPIPPQGMRPQGAPGQMPQGQRPVRLDENGRPIPPQGMRPQGAPGQMPQGQRPVRLDENGRPIPPQGMPAARPQARPVQDDAYDRDEDAYDPRRRMRAEEEPEANSRFDLRRNYPDTQPRASVNRPKYDFEEDSEEDVRPRRGNILVPLVVVLLVIGGLLAGILLPDWDGMGGGIGTAMGKIKSTVGGVFGSIREIISPEEAGVKSFSVSPTNATAPVELVFSVQASTSVTDIRILDQDGNELLSKTLADSDLLNGEVTKNSKYNIWTLRYTCETAYSGVFTAQNMKKDGTWDTGMTTTETVSIAPPVVAEPPVQDFEADTTQGTAPATVGFTVVTSLDVSAVQVVNDYGDVVAEAYLSDAGSQVTENEDTRTWSLNGQIQNAYTGSFYATYETDADLSFTQSDYSVDVTLTAASQQPADQTAGDNADVNADVNADDGENADVNADANADDGANADLTAKNADTSSLTDENGDTPAADTPDEGLTDTPEQTEQATAEATVTPAATVAATATPAPTTLPLLTATADESAAPAALKLATSSYVESKLKDTYEREKKIVIVDPFQYAVWDQSGVLTFRDNPFRQNAAFGTVELSSKTMTELWKVPVEGSIKAKSSTLNGVGWPGQAIIVKWPTQLRALLGIKDDAKSTQALKEVIVGAQNGKIYFLNLVSGALTRDPIENDWPSNGSMSLQTNASPMLAVGQHIGVLAKVTVDNGLHLYNLLNNKELTMLKGKEKLMQSNYSGFNGAPLFDKTTGTMIVGGENGLLYTMEPGDDFDHIMGTLKLTPSVQKYAWLAAKQKAKNTNIDGSVAMYGSYAYFGDQSGIVQCVDVNTLSPVWAVNTGDNVDATVALDMESDTAVSLYTGNTILNQGRTGVCTIRKLDALTGKELWAFTVPDVAYTTEAQVGCVASPVVGRQNAGDLVFFTVTNGAKNATLYALSKSDGSVKWTLALTSPTISSPVAVYNAAGDAWIIQAEGTGKLHLIDALTGTEASNLQLEGSVEASPAVYRDVLVISTTGKDQSYIYGIKLE